MRRGQQYDCDGCELGCRYADFRVGVDVGEIMRQQHADDKRAADDGETARGVRQKWTWPERRPGVSRGTALHVAHVIKLSAWRAMLAGCDRLEASERVRRSQAVVLPDDEIEPWM